MDLWEQDNKTNLKHKIEIYFGKTQMLDTQYSSGLGQTEQILKT